MRGHLTLGGRVLNDKLITCMINQQREREPNLTQIGGGFINYTND